jgi:hypothetical protein
MRTRYVASSTELSPYVACRLEFNNGALAAKPESPIMSCLARAAAACKAERSAPLPRCKWLSGKLSRITFPYICARKGV